MPAEATVALRVMAVPVLAELTGLPLARMVSAVVVALWAYDCTQVRAVESRGRIDSKTRRIKAQEFSERILGPSYIGLRPSL